MPEPIAVYGLNRVIFDNSISLSDNIILDQGRWSLVALVEAIDRLYSILAGDRLLSNMYVDPQIADMLHVITHHHGLAASILLNTTPRGNKETKTIYDARIRRHQYIQSRLGGVQFPTLQNRKLRNILTHMEDHLAQELQRPNTAWAIDMAILSEDQFVIEKRPGTLIEYCRTYVARTNTIRHLGYTISLTDLREEASKFLYMVWGMSQKPPPERPEIRYNFIEGFWEKHYENLPSPG
ncbi:hypothetical protein L905_05250 [Agrobacterium sp. TS43]|uniref:hypothetical protein n=1 Tax=Agrobacterium TaxID=357 RepID=UPI000360BB38|nr:MULTISPECIES: hypothetical protein [Agrobacterium]EPR20468.1 hypothetical protein L902_29815 [Agrobacterium radiobacter DSM 30147]KDR90896.1 hypothetical protein K538_18530 [Agrobacterium tumefaciens GW4]KVK52242.1 hypothetical protein L903_02530 [Agrobacterium sp. JL28]KVK53164.1 hypothetical protein L904_02380 [Agrobacterium sp. LY4]KVK64585.1 hypothetical protein L906_02515 [Agrobacterium sp. TS45]